MIDGESDLKDTTLYILDAKDFSVWDVDPGAALYLLLVLRCYCCESQVRLIAARTGARTFEMSSSKF